ncbi:hypothetical protein KFK09_027368 [Dendrobium nobile]|uniref:Uncharacterized protein n=1 Tax=Dendrobium nobile TaxID=94219 RepID=A0A8T3ABD8_DENNO|nr:hypothetical protein KFK09_027368 [Dendrobium nobile]
MLFGDQSECATSPLRSVPWLGAAHVAHSSWSLDDAPPSAHNNFSSPRGLDLHGLKLLGLISDRLAKFRTHPAFLTGARRCSALSMPSDGLLLPLIGTTVAVFHPRTLLIKPPSLIRQSQCHETPIWTVLTLIISCRTSSQESAGNWGVKGLNDSLFQKLEYEGLSLLPGKAKQQPNKSLPLVTPHSQSHSDNSRQHYHVEEQNQATPASS